MSSINSIGQNLFQYYRSARSTSGAAPVSESNPDTQGAPDQTAEEADQFGAALLITLQQFGIDPQAFQHDFLAAMRGVTRAAKPTPASGPMSHINTVG